MVRFIRDYRGKVTGIRFFVSGTETDEFSAETERYLISVNAVEKVAKAKAATKTKVEENK